MSAFLPGPLSTAYTAASLPLDSGITVTRVTASLTTAPDTNCQSTQVQVMNGTNGTNLVLAGGQSYDDSGPIVIPGSAAPTSVQVALLPGSCVTTPANANVLVEYRAPSASDTQTCSASAMLCSGICSATQTDPNNCGGCGVVCASGTCSAGSCGNPGGCTSNSQCPSGYYCGASATCVAEQPNGTPCTSANSCASSYCSDGYCCNSACTDSGESCSGALTGGVNGICAAILPGASKRGKH